MLFAVAVPSVGGEERIGRANQVRQVVPPWS